MNIEDSGSTSADASPPAAVENAKVTDSVFSWPAAIWIGGCHVFALAAPFCFTVEAAVVAVVLSWLTGGLGICVGFHRLLTHSGFQTYAPVRGALAVLGCLAGEGPPIMWVAAHRRHHQFSDQPGDPHSPRDGFWWSHVTWMLSSPGSLDWAEQYRRYAPDILRDPFLRFLNRRWLWLHATTGVLLLAAGWIGGGWQMGVSLLVYGLFVRLVWVFHVTWFVNSASHRWGYQTYNTGDDSRNLWWVGLFAYGEGWHNNHHAHPRLARHGHRWWEIDVNYWFIFVLKKLHLVWDVVDRIDHLEATASTPLNQDLLKPTSGH